MIAVFTGDGGDHFRTSVNQWRQDDGSTATIIRQYVHVWTPYDTFPQHSHRCGQYVHVWNPLDGVLNNLITTFFLVVPVPLLILLKPYYVASALLMTTLWTCFLAGYVKLLHGRDVWARRAFAVMAGFLIVQGVFEPDFGSALRHLVPMIPMLLLLQSFTVADAPNKEDA